MIYLSEILIRNPQLNSFDQLIEEIKSTTASSQDFHLKIDIKPNYPDTPSNWEDAIEGAFSGIHSVFGRRNDMTEED